MASAVLLAGGTGEVAADDGYRPVTIAYIAENKAGGGAAHLGEGVSVRGVVSTATDTYKRGFNLIYIQDDAAGIAVYDPDHVLPSIAPGDVVEVRGTIGEYRGLAQMVAESGRTLRSGAPPRPLDLRIEEAASGRFSGRLVRVKGRVDSMSRASGLKVDFATTHDTDLSFYFYRGMVAQVEAMGLEPGMAVRVTGIASQFDPVPPFDEGWQILPRGAADVTVLSEPLFDSTLAWRMFGALAVLAASVFAWIAALRRQVQRKTASLAETLAVLRTQQEATLDGILISDATGLVSSFNSRFRTIWGMGEVDLIGAPIADVLKKQAELVVEPERYLTAVNGAAAGADPVVIANEEVPMRDGGILSLASVPIVSEKGTHCGRAWYFEDVTRKRLLERQVEQASRVASLGRLSAGVAHEFNNVLMGIQPFVDLLKMRSEDERSRQALDRIGQSVARGKRITSEILRFTRPVEPSLRSLSLRESFAAIEDQLRSILKPRIELRIGALPEIFIAGDLSLLTQIFVNLAVNAEDAMPDGGSIHVSASRDEGRTAYPFGVVPPGKFLHLTFSDTGTGIPADLMPHIFEPLFTTKRSRGTGLGLALVQQLVSTHGGVIFAESRIGEGTTFHVFLQESGAGEPDGESEEEKTRIAPCEILLIEDEAQIAEGIAASLASRGLLVRAVGSGEEGLSEVETRVPDAVILDVDLPGIGGVEVFTRLRKNWPALPVVFSTAHHDPELVAHCLARPGVKILLKPYDTDALLNALSDLSAELVA